MRFDSLDGIRGLAALAVVLFHLQPTFPGYLAVDLFFILSGFVLSFRYFDSTRSRDLSLADFVVARLSRLYPLHLFTLLAVLAIYLWFDSFPPTGEGYIFSFIVNLLLIQNTGISTWWLTWNEPSWSISVELWVNIIVFAYLAIKCNTLTLLLLSLGSYILLLANNQHLDLHIHMMFNFINTGLLRCFAGFFLGMVLFRVYQRVQMFDVIKPGWQWFVTFSFLEIAAFAASAYLMFVPAKQSIMDYNAPFAFAALVLIFSFQLGVLSKLINLTRLTYLGTLSFSIYLNHYWVLALMRHLHIPHYGFNSEVVINVFSILLPISIATYYLIEKPGQAYSRKLYGRVKHHFKPI